ncbi:hypothetical protein Kfla_4606 [Kribbella flavida DSM 17836]|uniref:tRNA nuclease CdiA C-terminal domain-containing protein n=1 Tax=Kribbella flavida (strain DSM 17836 / JCM 10339 / NBRC 14399) TaxID=479435 RepID=D2PY18_KRIFD|nr:hypothetical protein [Kribbella flavida]ADB33624.1 hypothetical protein Kfla_4606 [Kribbella flavida DSM 17836]
MPSDLQRVARGLVECLDEVPQVVIHLQRTAERCRENAAVAIAASHGQATVAAQQLDAAARACEAAAHYLAMAPPKAKAWAERLVGERRSTDRPDAGSADRNRATGGIGDVAERDSKGRTKRLSARYRPVEDPEAPEPPLIVVARKAMEKFRKRQEKDEQDREETPEPLEVEIVVDPEGRLNVSERDEDQERRDEDEPDYEIAVDLGEAARKLLEAMAAGENEAWQRAELVIAVDRVTATFDYPEEPPEPLTPPVVEVELPEFEPGEEVSRQAIDVPAVEVELERADGEPGEFDPAFEPRAFGDDFRPGVHDPQNSFLAKELAVAKRLEQEGWRIDARVPDHGSGEKNPDTMVRRSGADAGVKIEFKTLRSGSSEAVKRNVLDGSEQVLPDGELVIDGRDVGLAEAVVDRSMRAFGQPGRTVAAVVHFILADGRLVTYKKEY